MRGKVKINNPSFGCVGIGFESTSAFDYKKERAIWDNDGNVIFEGKATLGQGARISNHGKLHFGEGFRLIANSNIICNKNISFGNDCLISWDVQVLDTDFHKIYNEKQNRMNFDAPITVGNHVWVCSRCSLLKGTKIADDNVVASNSTISNICMIQNALIGNCGRIIKENINWKP